MCSFGSCQTRFELLSQFRKVECFVTQVQTRLPKTKCVWPMKINVICTVRRQTPHYVNESGPFRGNSVMQTYIFLGLKKSTFCNGKP